MVRLKRVRVEDLTIHRLKHGKGYRYTDEEGRRISDRDVVARARSLAIPPAWSEVCIAERSNAHIQAIGTDAAGRRQYIYHPDWEVRRSRRKQHQLALLADALPRIRRRVREDLLSDTGTKELALAIGVAMIDRTAMRLGRERYLDAHGTRGAGTLYSRDIAVRRGEVQVSFPAKSGKRASYAIVDERLADAVERISLIRGKRLLMYRDAEGKARTLRTEDINRYLREIAGAPVTAKDFRTLHGSAMAGEALAKLEPGDSASARKRQMTAVTRQVAAFLQNTPAICRASYVAPCLYALFEKGRLGELWLAGGDGQSGLRQREARLAAVLEEAG